MTRQTRLIRLPDGTPVWARIDPGGPPAADRTPGGVPGGMPLGPPGGTPCDAPERTPERSTDSAPYGGEAHPYPGDPYDDYDYEDVGALDGALARVSRLREVITGVAASVRDAAERAAPDEIGVEFGVEFAVRGGAIVSVLADAQTTGTLKVTLTWKDRLGRATPQPVRPAPEASPPTVPSTGGTGDV